MTTEQARAAANRRRSFFQRSNHVVAIDGRIFEVDSRGGIANINYYGTMTNGRRVDLSETERKHATNLITGFAGFRVSTSERAKPSNVSVWLESRDWPQRPARYWVDKWARSNGGSFTTI